MSFLSLQALRKTYPDGTLAVRGLDLDIERGEFVVLLGPSGCGKTTTLRMIAGLETASSGSIRMQGRDVTLHRPSQRDVGMVFQFYALYPHLSIRDNIAFPLRAARVPAAERESRVDGIAARMNLERFLRNRPRQLSGGDQQKVSLARAIVRRPALYLMDEPLGTLDADQRLAMRELIRAEQLESHVTTLYVTHDQEEAMSLADRIVVMADGCIRQLGTPSEVYDRPSDQFVASFVGNPGMNFVSGEVCRRSGPDGASAASRGGENAFFRSERGGVRLDVPPASRLGRATLGVRAEHVQEDAQGPIAGTVVTEEYLGNARNVHVETDLGRLVFRTHGGASHQRGSLVRLRLDTAHISLFDPSTEERL